MVRNLKQLANDLLHLGDVFGKILTLVGLPGAALVFVLFYAEFWDRVTAPDVVGRIDGIELRCALRLDGTEQDFGEACSKSSTGVSFEVVLNNTDTIERQLVEVVARVTFDPTLASAKPDRWMDLAQVVEHLLHNDYEAVVRMPWRALRVLRITKFHFRS